MRKQSGDALLDLLVVIAIVLIMIACAIPNLLRASRADRESQFAGPSADIQRRHLRR